METVCTKMLQDLTWLEVETFHRNLTKIAFILQNTVMETKLV